MMMITHRRVLDMYIVVAFFDESDSTLAMLVLYHPSSHSSPTGNLAIFSESSVFCGRARIVPKQTSLSLLSHFVHDEMKESLYLHIQSLLPLWFFKQGAVDFCSMREK